MTIYEKLKECFNSLRKNLKDTLVEFLTEKGNIEFDYKEVYDDLDCRDIIPTALVSDSKSNNVIVTYYNCYEVEEFGFDEAEEYNDFIECFSLDELYFIANCINDYRKVNVK